ncbi:MAG TPA: AAA family ATPase [Polyangiaceae bacterium]|nr:AAA family ATPase [Polyangiaceae bacterium]
MVNAQIQDNSQTSGVRPRLSTSALEAADEYAFGSYRLDLRDERLWCGERALALKPKAFRVLERLVRERGRLVTKSELLADLWADVTVGEAVLKVCIGEIRAALGDASDEPRFIQTVHGRGYRFVAPMLEHPLKSALLPLLVGRSFELELLQQGLSEAKAGNSQALLITGEGGIGKTALLDTFLRRLEAEWGQKLWFAHGHCAAHQGSREPYMPLLEALGRMSRGPNAEAFTACAGRCAPTWLAQLRGHFEAPGALSDARVPGGALGRVLREMGDLIEALSEQRPLVLSVEDLHWSDRSTLDLLGYLAKRRGQARLLLIGTSRSSGFEAPPSQNPWTVSLTAPVDWQEIALYPLSVREVTELVNARFAEPVWAADIARRLRQQTGGNPLFLRSVLAHLQQSKTTTLGSGRWSFEENSETWQVPRELQAFIRKRFAGTGASARRVLELASVVGMEFDPALVAASLNTELSEIVLECEAQMHHGFLDRARGNGPLGGAGLYCFSHALYQQALYDALPVARRVSHHRSIAEVLERSAASKPVISELAHHCEQAQAYDKAVHYHALAGENAHQGYAYHEAVSHLKSALHLLQHLPEGPARSAQELQILISLGQPLINIQGWTALEVERTYRRALALCAGVGAQQRFAALAGLYKFFLARGHFDTASEIAEQCVACASEIGARPLQMTGHALRGIVLYFHGSLADARHELETSRALYDFSECQSFAQIFGDDPAVGCLGFLGRVEWHMGDRHAGLAHGRSALALARDLGHPHVIATALALLIQLYAWSDDEASVAELTAELTRISQNQSFALWSIVAEFFSAWLRARGGDATAPADLQSALDEYDAFGAALDRPTYATLLAEVCCRLKQRDLAVRVVEQALRTPPHAQLWEERLVAVRRQCQAGSRSRPGAKLRKPRERR